MIKTIQDYSYKVTEHIGKGYSSTVHKGINQKTKQQICIKVIQMSKLQDPINQMLLQYQVSALRSLSFSPNILHLFDVYATKNNTYIITQLCDCDLSSLLKEKKQFMYYDAVEILKQLISGYMDIYRQGYLHRDIKPANVFCKNGVYKFGDFGFAIPIKQVNQHKNYNVGSPVYMPPEALKQNIYSVSCDTWAIGVIFFQLLKGVVPWRAISEQKLYEKIMSEPLSELTLGLPQAARIFLAKILHLDPTQRMTPEQLSSWPQKLFYVQIRHPTSNILSPSSILHNKLPLQQISCFTNDHQNRQATNNNINVNSRSNSFHKNNNNVPLKKYQSQNNQISVVNIISPSPIGQNKININANINKINFFTVLEGLEREKQKQKQRVSLLKVKENLINLNINKQHNSFNECQYYSEQMLNYLKLVHRVIKFIGQPTVFPLKDLQYSLTKHLYKQIERIEKIKQAENVQLFSVNKWRQFLKSPKAQKFNQNFNKLSLKCRMFHLLPKDEFILQVYRDQLNLGIQRLSQFLQNQQNYTEKVVIALDYLLGFYNVFLMKERNSYKQFLANCNLSQMIEEDSYSLVKQEDYLLTLRKRAQSMGLITSKHQYSSQSQPLILNNTFQYMNIIKN